MTHLHTGDRRWLAHDEDMSSRPYEQNRANQIATAGAKAALIEYESGAPHGTAHPWQGAASIADDGRAFAAGSLTARATMPVSIMYVAGTPTHADAHLLFAGHKYAGAGACANATAYANPDAGCVGKVPFLPVSGVETSFPTVPLRAACPILPTRVGRVGVIPTTVRTIRLATDLFWY